MTTQHKTNLGVRPLGGKFSTASLSPALQKEIDRDLAFANLFASLPPSNSNENARLHRAVHAAYNPEVAAWFDAYQDGEKYPYRQ